jgi:hypothetical protein
MGRVVRLSSATVTLPRYLVVETAMDAASLASELEESLRAIEQRLWAGNRAGAVDAITRAHRRVEQMRTSFTELAGIADLSPTEPEAARAA